MQTLRRIVCGTDFSAHAEEALALALELAFATGAQLTLAHVCELGAEDTEDTDDTDDTGSLDTLHEEQRLARCRERLAAVVARPAHRHVQVSGVLRSGRPWEKLDNVAAEVGASLIVIGRHGAGRGLSAELGTVAAHLIRSASRPLLLVGRGFDPHDDEPRDEPSDQHGDPADRI